MMDTMAAKEGGANPMMDAGMGLAMGQVFGNMMNQQQRPMQNQMPPAPQVAPPPVATIYHYNGVAGQGQFSAADIAQKVASNRTGVHNVWTAGMAGWQSWNTVPEIANMVPPAPVAPPPMMGAEKYHYAENRQQKGEVSAMDIANAMKANPTGEHMVWKNGMPGWTNAKDVAEITQLLQASAPPPFGGPPPFSGPPPM
jgi:hypothetical protein